MPELTGPLRGPASVANRGALLSQGPRRQDEPLIPVDTFAQAPKPGQELPDLTILRQLCKSDLQDAEEAHSHLVQSNASLTRELRMAAKRYEKQDLDFSEEDRESFVKAFADRHRDVRFDEDHAYGQLSRDLQSLLGTLEQGGGGDMSPREKKKTAHLLFDGYQRLAKDPSHARESLAFVSKVASDEKSPLYQMFEAAGLTEKIQANILEPALPAAWTQIKRSNHENPQELREQLLTDLCGEDPARRSDLAEQIEKDLPAALVRAEEIAKVQGQELVHGVLKEACGLLTGVPAGLFGLGAAVALTHAVTMMRTKENRKEAAASLFDGTTQVTMGLAKMLKHALLTGVLEQVGGVCGGLAAAVTLKQHYDECRENLTVGTGMDLVGDVAGVASGLLFLAPAAGTVALGLGLASAGMAVGAAILKHHDQKVLERRESEQILQSAVPSFKDVVVRENAWRPW